MIERYLNDDLCERFVEIRLSLGGLDEREDDFFISTLLDTYEKYNVLKFRFRKLKFKYELLKFKLKDINYLLNKYFFKK